MLQRRPGPKLSFRFRAAPSRHGPRPERFCEKIEKRRRLSRKLTPARPHGPQIRDGATPRWQDTNELACSHLVLGQERRQVADPDPVHDGCAKELQAVAADTTAHGHHYRASTRSKLEPRRTPVDDPFVLIQVAWCSRRSAA